MLWFCVSLRSIKLLNRTLAEGIRRVGSRKWFNCPQCAATGSLRLLEKDRRNGEALVRCKKCAHQWTMVP